MIQNILGVGWLSRESYGMERLGKTVEYASRVSIRTLGRDDQFFSYPVKNFGRFDSISKRVCYVTALALKDAGMDYSKDWKQDVGLLGTDEFGSEQANRTYFQDYIDGGRTMARANLFIYTLPSSPLAEAAVHFGLQGPLFYFRNQKESVDRLLVIAQRMLAEGQAKRMLVYDLTDELDRCLVVTRPDDEEGCGDG